MFPGGNSGIGISASVGVDLIAPKISLNADVGLSTEDIVSAKVNADMGWLKDKVGLGAKLPLSPWESLRIFGYHQGVIDEIKKYDEWGAHMKMGVVYVVAVAALLAYGVVNGVYDVQTALQQLQQYWDSLKGCI